MIDLHTHSIFSDGSYTPKELIEEAAQIGLKAIALTDHDSINGCTELQQAAKKYPALDLWFILFETYLKTIDAKDASAYSNVVFKAMSQLCGSIRDVRLIKYIDQLIQMMPNAIGIRMLKFLYEYGCENYFVSKSFNQIKKMIDTVLPYDEENIDFVHELMKHVDNLMFVYKKHSLGFKVFEHIVSYISKKYDNVLCDYLVYMGNIALFLGTYNETAKKYFNNAPRDRHEPLDNLALGIKYIHYLQQELGSKYSGDELVQRIVIGYKDGHTYSTKDFSKINESTMNYAQRTACFYNCLNAMDK